MKSILGEIVARLQRTHDNPECSVLRSYLFCARIVIKNKVTRRRRLCTCIFLPSMHQTAPTRCAVQYIAKLRGATSADRSTDGLGSVLMCLIQQTRCQQPHPHACTLRSDHHLLGIGATSSTNCQACDLQHCRCDLIVSFPSDSCRQLQAKGRTH